MGRYEDRSKFKICRECGKRFYLSCGGPWAWQIYYKGHRYTFCSYNCKRKFEKRILEELKE